VKSGFIDNYSNGMVASNDVGAEVATLLTGPAWLGQRAVEQTGVPKGHTGAAEEMFEAVNSAWMDLGVVKGAEHVAGTTSARDVFAAAQKAATA